MIRFNNGNGGVTCHKCKGLFVTRFETMDEHKYWAGIPAHEHMCEQCKIEQAVAGDDS